MFTGIVEERGTVEELALQPPGARLVVQCREVGTDSWPGASVAVNGVCLTVVERGVGTLAFDLAPETLGRSALGTLSAGDPVNLERPVTLATRMGGHLVQGHVDGVGTVADVETFDGGGAVMTVRLPDGPQGLARYVVEKGSIAVDGVSLTVTQLVDDSFAVALVPHTLEATTLGQRKQGDPVNLEVDVMAKYVEGLLRRGR
ncbi:MAG TPA: riboflavin synthase [Actinomycetota bacterium]|nr:riboflavin synthase [Actinomycetota bacterium]